MFFFEETNGYYLFANGLNRLIGLVHLWISETVYDVDLNWETNFVKDIAKTHEGLNHYIFSI
jgi:hypothetical protein